MRTHALLASFILAASCQAETQSYIVSDVNLTFEGTPFARDFDADGAADNSLPDWVNLWNVLGFDLQDKFDTLLQSGTLSIGVELELNHRAEGGALLRAFRATPEERLFDGTDQLTKASELFSFEGEASRVSPGLFHGLTDFAVSGERFEWVIVPFDSSELLTLPLRAVEIRGSLRENSAGIPKINQGAISGLVPALEVARILEKIPAAFDALQVQEAAAFTKGEPLPCQQRNGLALECIAIAANGICTDTNEDNLSTGFCVSDVSTIARAMAVGIDADGDGHYIVEFDETVDRFIRNDLSPLFDLASPSATPTGLFGPTFFTIDTDQDGNPDAMPVSIGFGSVRALPAP
jgi:hypothetical protein